MFETLMLSNYLIKKTKNSSIKILNKDTLHYILPGKTQYWTKDEDLQLYHNLTLTLLVKCY